MSLTAMRDRRIYHSISTSCPKNHVELRRPFECVPLQLQPAVPSATVSTLPYSRTRNRRGRVHLVNCKGSILITFPSTSTSLDFDIAFELQHSLHPGREYFGVPVSIREWIKAHPFSTPKAQRDELLRSIQRGEIEGVSEKYLSGP